MRKLLRTGDALTLWWEERQHEIAGGTQWNHPGTGLKDFRSW
jgi:hypothetical protein